MILQVSVSCLRQLLLISFMALLPGYSGGFNFFLHCSFTESSRLVRTSNLLIETHARYSRAMPVSAQQNVQ